MGEGGKRLRSDRERSKSYQSAIKVLLRRSWVGVEEEVRRSRRGD